MKSEFRADLHPVLRAKLEATPRKERIWNGWRRYQPRLQGCITHAWEEGVTAPGLAICGSRISEGAGLNLTEVEPGCVRCRRILVKAGLIAGDWRRDQPTESAKPD